MPKERKMNVKRRILAFLLAFVMLFGLTAAVSAADTAKLTMTADYAGSRVMVTVAAENAQGMTNGQIKVSYDAENLTLVSAVKADACPLASVNTKTAGAVSMAWVGSKLQNESEELLTLVFDAKKPGEKTDVSATAVHAYASGKKMTVGGAAITLLCNPFTDIDGHWATDEILAAYHAGLFFGVSATEFGPEMSMTRGMFVTVLYRMEGSPAADASDLRYTDVAKDSYYAEAVAWADASGVVNGTGVNTFSPETKITRQEMVTMFFRYAAYKGEDVTATTSLSRFSDADEVAIWARVAMKWAVATGLIGGHSDWSIGPKEDATRAQAATVFCRYAGLS